MRNRAESLRGAADRIICTGGDLLRRFTADLCEFSLPVAWGRLCRDVPVGSWNKRQAIYERAIYRYLERKYGAMVERYAAEYDPHICKLCEEKRIWVMWWQGEENMPPVVKACWDRLNTVADDCDVTLITEHNWKAYVDLPEYIVRKIQGGVFHSLICRILSAPRF